MTIKDVTSLVEEIAPLHYAEDFDNVGLLVGDYNTKVSGVLVTLDTLEETVDEAIEKGCNLIRLGCKCRSPFPDLPWCKHETL